MFKVLFYIFVIFLSKATCDPNCNIPGYCLGGVLLMQEPVSKILFSYENLQTKHFYIQANEFEDCARFCIGDPDCSHYSFFESENVCFTYATCPEIFDDPSLPALTNEKGCQAEFCFIDGTQCHGNLVSVSKCADQYDCLSNCVDDINCNWFEFETSSELCSLFQDCATYDLDCPNCIIGSRNCSNPKDEMVLLLALGENSNGIYR